MKVYVVEMPDGSQWGVPVDIIARSRAEYHAGLYGGDCERSLKEGTLPLFAEYPYMIEDWATNNMDWEDVASYAFNIRKAPPIDFDAGWYCGHIGVIEMDETP